MKVLYGTVNEDWVKPPDNPVLKQMSTYVSMFAILLGVFSCWKIYNIIDNIITGEPVDVDIILNIILHL